MMMRGTVVALVLISIALAACAEHAARSERQASAPAPAETKATPVAPPAGSPLAKVQKGMRMGQVAEILGQPTDQNQYITGKAFIPFYYGGDVTRLEWHYKGLGRVVFTGGGAFGQGGGEVEWVEYDPQESGYRR
jgi:glucose/arabinose dehydrogenase